MKIGLYGGTFDPIHSAHLLIAEFIKDDLNLDKIIFIPSGTPPHKDVFFAARAAVGNGAACRGQQL